MTADEKTTGILSGNVIKYMAAACMLIGHTFDYLTDYSVLTGPVWPMFIGMVAMVAPPVFFFFIAEGFIYTRSAGKYAIRLLILAVVTQIPEMLARFGTIFIPAQSFFLNVVFELLFGLLALMLWESNAKLPLKVAGITGLLAVSFLKAEWPLGLIIILIFHIFRDKPVLRTVLFILAAFMSTFGSYLLHGYWDMFIKCLTVKGMFINNAVCFLYCIIGYILVTLFYSGERGRNSAFSKWFFYVFFPVQWLLIFGLMKIF